MYCRDKQYDSPKQAEDNLALQKVKISELLSRTRQEQVELFHNALKEAVYTTHQVTNMPMVRVTRTINEAQKFQFSILTSKRHTTIVKEKLKELQKEQNEKMKNDLMFQPQKQDWGKSENSF